MRKKARKEKLVSLTVMVSPTDLIWIKAQTYGTGDSMGRVIRNLIESNIRLQNAIVQAEKGEKEK